MIGFVFDEIGWAFGSIMLGAAVFEVIRRLVMSWGYVWIHIWF